MLRTCIDHGVHAVFRLQRNASARFREFVLNNRHRDEIVSEAGAEELRKDPRAALRPSLSRLVEYEVGVSDYTPAATLLNRKR